MAGMGPQPVPAITIPISFEENDSGNPSLGYTSATFTGTTPRRVGTVDHFKY